MTHPTTPTHLSPLTPAQAEALVRLLAKATKAGCLPSVLDTSCLLDLLDGGLPQRGAQPQVEAYEGGPR
jgi:hypothetical protein